jgi:hypothetical protein
LLLPCCGLPCSESGHGPLLGGGGHPLMRHHFPSVWSGQPMSFTGPANQVPDIILFNSLAVGCEMRAWCCDSLEILLRY